MALRLSEGLGRTPRLGKSLEPAESDRETRVQLLGQHPAEDDGEWT